MPRRLVTEVAGAAPRSSPAAARDASVPLMLRQHHRVDDNKDSLGPRQHPSIRPRQLRRVEDLSPFPPQVNGTIHSRCRTTDPPAFSSIAAAVIQRAAPRQSREHAEASGREVSWPPNLATAQLLQLVGAAVVLGLVALVIFGWFGKAPGCFWTLGRGDGASFASSFLPRYWPRPGTLQRMRRVAP